METTHEHERVDQKTCLTRSRQRARVWFVLEGIFLCQYDLDSIIDRKMGVPYSNTFCIVNNNTYRLKLLHGMIILGTSITVPVHPVSTQHNLVTRTLRNRRPLIANIELRAVVYHHLPRTTLSRKRACCICITNTMVIVEYRHFEEIHRGVEITFSPLLLSKCQVYVCRFKCTRILCYPVLSQRTRSHVLSLARACPNVYI